MRETVERIFKLFFQGVEYFCSFLLGVEVVVIGYVVFSRYIINNSPRWGDELARIVLIWFGLISAVLAIRSNSHVRITLFEKILSERGKKILYSINQIVILLFSLFMIVYGFQLSKMTARAILPGMEISRAWMYASLPVAGFTFLLAVIERFVKRRN